MKLDRPGAAEVMGLVMNLARHVLALKKEMLREFLATPMKAYQLKTKEQCGCPVCQKSQMAERIRWNKEQTDLRIKAMFALFDIPEDWPEELQWHQLALHLAGEAFKGCRTLSRGAGGPTKEKLSRIAELKRGLFKQFDAYKRAHPEFSENAAATNFLRKNREACQAAGLSKSRSFAKAMREARKETEHSNSARGS